MFSKETFPKQDKIKNFREWLEQFQIQESTINLYVKTVKTFLKYIEGKELNETTINKYLKKHPRFYVKAALKYYFRFIGYEIKLPKIKEPERVPIEPPTWETLKSKLKTIPSIDTYYTLLLLLYTGARVGDVLRIKVKHIKWKQNKILIPTKGGKYNIVFLPSNLMVELYQLIIVDRGLLNEEYILFPRSKRSSAYTQLRYYINKFIGDRQILKTHNFRRSVANLVYEITKNPMIVQAVLGHAKITTTMRYISEIEKQKAKIEGFSILRKKYGEGGGNNERR